MYEALKKYVTKDEYISLVDKYGLIVQYRVLQNKEGEGVKILIWTSSTILLFDSAKPLIEINDEQVERLTKKYLCA